MARLGIFGGTFDPLHYAHLALAEKARRRMKLRKVLWVLTPDPPHKDRPDLTPYPLRREMLRTAISRRPAFELCEVELERPGPHFMVDTVRILQERNPRAELFLLIGEDSLRDLPTWRDPRRLLERIPLVVMHRPGAKTDLAALESVLPDIAERIIFLRATTMDISSTAIRRRVWLGRSIRDLLPRRVEKIILREHLYARRKTKGGLSKAAEMM